MSASAILMSIRPVYADAILAGTKTVELRRRRPAFPEGTTVLVYSSSPHQIVRGAFRTGTVVGAPPNDLWKLVRDQAGVTRRAFDAYFDGCATAYAIEVREPRLLTPTILPVRPPQSYLVLRPGNSQHTPLWELAEAARRPSRALPLRAASFALGAAQRLAAAALEVASPPPTRAG